MNLKKSALAVAVASIIAAPTASTVFAADQDWDGRVHWQLQMDDNDQDGEDVAIAGAGHRIGVKGSGDANNGNKVGYAIEAEIQSASNPYASRDDGALEYRQANVYYAGDWGSVTVGRQNNPHQDVYKSDIFERTSGIYELAAGFRIGDAIVYRGDFGMFGVFGGLMMDGQGTDDGEDIDSTIIGANFNIGKSVAITVSNQTLAEEGSNADANAAGADLSVTGAGASWSGGALTVAGYYESESETSTNVIDVGVWYGLNDTTAVGGDYATIDFDGDEDATRILLGVYHQLGGGADGYVEYFDETWGEDDTQDNNGITVGYRVKFN